MKNKLRYFMVLSLMLGVGAPLWARVTDDSSPTAEIHRNKNLSSEELPSFLRGLDAVRGGRLDIALQLLEPLATQGVAEAQAALGLMLAGADNPSLARQGIDWLQAAARHNEWQAQLLLSDLYRTGKGVTRNDERADYWLQQAAKVGGVEAQAAVIERSRALLEQARDALERRDYAGAERPLSLSAQLGVISAQETLASLYSKGLLGEDKKEFAQYWFAKAAARGSHVAKYALAMSTLELGSHDAQSKNKAVQLLKQAADPGEQQAQYRLGMMALKGELPGTDPAQGVKWYRLAAEQGHSEAQYALGVRYLLGLGDEKDANEAHRWFKRAAMQGHAKAQHNLALAYQHGIGTKPDPKLAAVWREKSVLPHRAIADAAPRLTLAMDDTELLPLVASSEEPIAQSTLPPVLKPASKARPKQSWFDALPDESYMLQLSSSLARASAFDMLAQLQLDKNQAYVYAQKIKGQTWHVLQYGRFTSVKEAKQFAALLQKKAPGLDPIVRKVKYVREHLAFD